MHQNAFARKGELWKIAANHKSTTNYDNSSFLFSYFRQNSLVCCFAEQAAGTKQAARQFLTSDCYWVLLGTILGPAGPESAALPALPLWSFDQLSMTQ
jgi:hypothetical protein